MGRYLSGLLAGSAVMLVGYGLMKYTVPTPEQFIESLPPQYRAEALAKRASREKEAQVLFQAIRDNASAEGPIWQLKNVNTHEKHFVDPKKDLAPLLKEEDKKALKETEKKSL